MRHLHIFLSSPGDVSRERQLAREVIDRIQSERSYRERLKLEVVAWDKPGAGAAMPAQYEPQEAIDRGLKKPSECDIVVVIFWARMGTPLSDKYEKPDGTRYRSGTEYEFLNAVTAAEDQGRPDVVVYRRTDVPDIKMNDPQFAQKKEQWDRVEEFFAEVRNPDGSFRRFFKEYEKPPDFKELLDQELRDLIPGYLGDELREEAAPPTAPEEPVWTESPFPGLRAFLSHEAPIFFGRSRETDELVEQLSGSRSRFVAVVGASGSGKSSLVAAGLLSSLREGAIPGSRDWVIVRFTPGEVGDDPFVALVTALKPTLERHGRRPRDEAEKLRRNLKVLDEVVAMALTGKPDWAELLLFVDQFEEFFTLVAPKDQQGFANLLVRAAKTPRVRTVLTLRADFYHRCMDWPGLDELVAKSQFPLLTPRVGALHEMITRPAQCAGRRFDEGLVERMLDETGREPGALALMAFALSELWKARTEDGRLTDDAYASFGGVPGAIGKRAEETFDALEGLPSEKEAALARVFRELLEVDERGVATRRHTRVSHAAETPAEKRLVEALIEARLLVTSKEEDGATVQVAHEAIFRSWPRLKKWVQKTGDDLRLRRQVTQAALDWETGGRAEKYLWSDERAVDVASVLERLGLEVEDLTETERDFLGPIDGQIMLDEIQDPSTTHARRATIGVRLALLGDPERGDGRKGTGLREDGLPDINWCPVKGGEVTIDIQSNPDDPNSKVVDTITRTVEPFWIARYPVTVAQFQAFLPTGHAGDRWSLSRGISDWFREAYRPPKHRAGYANHPADSVNWYDAFAFCSWLSERLGYEVGLPSEFEWQLAATGGEPSRAYPWGPDWDPQQEPWRANTDESGLVRSTAVGLYPAGASPVGAHDMSGTVWEWCRNSFEDPHEASFPTSQNDRRAVRGGSWNGHQYRARTTSRYGNPPYYRNDRLGFRLVCASPTP